MINNRKEIVILREKTSSQDVAILIQDYEALAECRKLEAPIHSFVAHIWRGTSDLTWIDNKNLLKILISNLVE